MDHLSDLVSYVRRFLHSIVFGNRCRSANKNITNSYLASTIALSMICCKRLNKSTTELTLTIHEDSFIRHKHIVKDNETFLTSIDRIATVHIASLRIIKTTKVARLPSIVVCYALCVSRNSTTDCIVLVLIPHRKCWHD